jgi:hypothetical protein
MNKSLFVLCLITALGKSAVAQVVEIPAERPLMYPLPDRALIRITYFDSKTSDAPRNPGDDEPRTETPRIKEQQISKFGDTMLSRVELSNGTSYDTWRVDGRVYAPAANQNRYVSFNPGSSSDTPFFPDPYGTFSWVGEKTFVRTEKTADGDVWIFRAPPAQTREHGREQMDGEPRPEPPPIEVRILAKTRFPIALKIGDSSYGIQITPGVPTSLAMPESLRESLVETAQGLAREISPLPPR